MAFCRKFRRPMRLTKLQLRIARILTEAVSEIPLVIYPGLKEGDVMAESQTEHIERVVYLSSNDSIQFTMDFDCCGRLSFPLSPGMDSFAKCKCSKYVLHLKRPASEQVSLLGSDNINL